MKRKERLSYADKNKNKQEWYRDRIDTISSKCLGSDDRLRMKVNYDLFNNRIKSEEFDYICKPFGDKVGKLPASMQNRDIVSGKIKTLIGMEMQRPFTYKVFSTNPEATTQREKKEFEMIREYVVNEIMAPIQQEIQQAMERQKQQIMQDPNAQNPEMQEQLQQQMAQLDEQAQEQVKLRTPQEVKKYMQREYQDPAEVLSSQLLEYLRYKCNLKRKFSDMFKNALLTARSVMYVGIVNDEPEVWVVNPMKFNFSKSNDTKYIEDSEWAVCEYSMSPSQIATYFQKELTDKDLDAIYEASNSLNTFDSRDLFSFDDQESIDRDISVFHCVWKSLRRIGFLTYIDENGEEQSSLVDEHFKFDVDAGEVSVEWEWIPEVYEGWKININDPIYVGMRPVPGQFKDLDNLGYSKLPYYGCVYDAYNSTETSLMDRIKHYQYFYNIIMYRLELLMASDKGKKLLMNINNVPDSLGIDIAKWQYFVESSPYIWYNPAEEGGQTQDANTVAKVMDLSLVSDIKKYMEIAEYIKQQCGKSVGITEQVEGQIGQYEAVRNTNQALIQSSYILEGYFDIHEECKTNILTALLEMAKVCYSKDKPHKINYVLDDLSKYTIDVDPTLLDNSTLGIFVTNSGKTERTKELIQQLSQAALQTQTVDFTDIISIMNAESVPEAEEILKASQQRKQEQMEQQQKQQQEYEQQMAQQQQEAAQRQLEMQKELIVLKEEERRKTEIAKISIMGASFNPDQDIDENGVNDFVELSKLEIERLKVSDEAAFRKEEFAHRRQMEIAKSNREDQKVKNDGLYKKQIKPSRI